MVVEGNGRLGFIVAISCEGNGIQSQVCSRQIGSTRATFLLAHSFVCSCLPKGCSACLSALPSACFAASRRIPLATKSSDPSVSAASCFWSWTCPAPGFCHSWVPSRSRLTVRAPWVDRTGKAANFGDCIEGASADVPSRTEGLLVFLSPTLA